MKWFRVIFFNILLFFISSCVQNTSTPEEYRNNSSIQKDIYANDVKSIKAALASYIDSVDATRKTKPKSKILSIEIDTIFYGPKDKITFLYLSKKKNPYVINNKDSLQYVGGCFIAKKINKDNSIKIIDELKYKITTSEIPNNMSRDLRIMYLREMGYIKGKYNINDNRFWESEVWE
ncbi:hypothetical protein [Ascidiimonas aurantiaca]|uniref:hypothetical protein n=1 Tax=Ascidiimonas aurantiaca TaxID=1685432 RepID=UPI0030EC1516